jgi:hypothetical protein
METIKDYSELLALFNAQEVDYLIVGAYALAYYGAPRYTGDLDIYVRPDQNNAARVLRALDAFGFGGLDVTIEDLAVPNKVVQLGYPPVRIDLVTSLTGITWQEAASGRAKASYGAVPVFYIGRNELIRNKRILGRMKDLADVEALGEER